MRMARNWGGYQKKSNIGILPSLPCPVASTPLFQPRDTPALPICCARCRNCRASTPLARPSNSVASSGFQVPGRICCPGEHHVASNGASWDVMGLGFKGAEWCDGHLHTLFGKFGFTGIAVDSTLIQASIQRR